MALVVNDNSQQYGYVLVYEGTHPSAKLGLLRLNQAPFWDSYQLPTLGAFALLPIG